VYVQGTGIALVIAILYRPPASSSVTFLDEFADIIERIAVYSAPLIVLGDINIHMDNLQLSAVVKLTNILTDFDLVQNVTGATHTAGHTLDVFITRSDMQAQVTVEPPIISDHSMITAAIKFDDVQRLATPTTVRRSWRSFDIDAFKNDLMSADLVVNPPDNCDDFFTLYDSTLKSLLDKHAPLRQTATRRRQSAPWFNAECRRIKAKTRRLEKIYRSTRTDDARRRWREQFTVQRSTFQKLYAAYWRKAINDSEDSKTLWHRLNALLQPSGAVLSPFSASDFATFFNGKIAAIRASTAAAGQPTVDVRDVSPLDTFGATVTAEDVAASLRRATCKQCELDPAPTWLVKQCSDVLSPVIASMINCSFSTSTFPACQKQALVKPLLKKPSMDPFDMKSYRPVSNLTFIGKFLERFAVNRLHEHAAAHCLFPVYQSAYRPRHSTETAVVHVLDKIFRAVDSGKVCALVLLDLSAAFDTVDQLDSADGAETQIRRSRRRARLVQVVPD